MTEWRACTLGDVITLQRGFDLPLQDRRQGTIPVIASTGPVGVHCVAQVRAPGIVIGRSGSIGGGQFLTTDFWPLNTTLWVKDFKGNDPRFCYYLLRGIDFSTFNVGSGVPTLNRNHVHPLPVTIPQPSEQSRISGLLGALDDKIELNRRTNETLEAMAQAIFRDWFVDFGPVRRKLAGAADPVEIMGGLAPDPSRAAALAALFPNNLGDDDLPLGWEAGFADNLVEFNPKEPLKRGTLAPYSDMSSLPTSGSCADAPIMREFGSGMRFRNGDALLARITPCLENGKSAFVDMLPDNTVGWGSTEFIVLRGRPATPAPFCYLLCRDPDFRAHAIQSMTGSSGRQRAQADSLTGWPMAIPSEAVLSVFGDYVIRIFDRISANGVENRTLTEIRDYLLPRLMSGAVRVSDVEQTEVAR